LDNNEITDEELSDDEEAIITKGKDFLFPDINNLPEENVITNELEVQYVGDSFEFILDNTDINFSKIIEPVEPVVIDVPNFTSNINIDDIPGPSNNIKSPPPNNSRISSK
jgi:hypothetical protein